MRAAILIGLAVAAILTACLIPAIPQSQSYHHYADARAFLGLPNALNVLTNLPFLIIGIAGLLRRTRPAWIVFFAALVLTSLGSAGYHLNPCDATLLWDRLPIAVLSMSLLAAVLEERTSARLVVPLVLLGVAATMVWRWHGDLSFYVAAMAYAPLAVATALLLYPGTGTESLFAALGLYGAARLCELADAPIFALGGVVSGHSLKHLLAAAAALVILRRLGLGIPILETVSPISPRGR
jgi:hypothetical protein